jgi:hypothetical protein
MADGDDRTWSVRYEMRSLNPDKGEWKTNQTYGPTTEALARHMIKSWATNDHYREMVLLHGDEIVD